MQPVARVAEERSERAGVSRCKVEAVRFEESRLDFFLPLRTADCQPRGGRATAATDRHTDCNSMQASASGFRMSRQISPVL